MDIRRQIVLEIHLGLDVDDGVLRLAESHAFADADAYAWDGRGVRSRRGGSGGGAASEA